MSKKVVFFNAGYASSQLLLDVYPNAFFAYSLRKLKSSYSGALVQIRRSSDNSTKDFYPDASNAFSLTSEDGSGTSLSSWIGSDDGFVTTWYNQDGGNDATQTSASSQPQILSSGSLILQNGNPSIQFNGISQWLGTGVTDQSYRDSSGFSFYLVHANNYSASIGFDRVFTKANSSGNGSEFTFQQDAATSNTVLFMSPSFIITLTMTNGNQYLTSINDASKTVTGYVNNLYQGGFTYVSQGLNAREIRIGTIDPLQSITYYDGKIQEIVTYASDKSSDRLGIQANINSYYSIY